MAQQLNFDQLKAQIEAAGLSTAAFVTEFNRLRASGADVNNLLRTMDATLDGIQDRGRDIGTTFGGLVTTLKNITSEFSNSDSAVKDVTKSYKGLVSVAQKMQYEEEGIYAYNVKQLKALKDRTAALTVDLNEAMARMTHEEKLEMYGANYVELLQDRLRAETELNKKIEDRLNLEKKVEKTFGATGALIEGSSKLLGAMGFGHLSSELSELGDDLKTKLRDELEKSGDEANKLALSFKYMGKGLAGSAKIFANGLTDPLFIVGKIFETYLEINKASVDLQRLTGQNAVKFENIGANAATLKDTLETISELTKQTGMNAQNIFSSEVLGQAAALKTTMGLTAEEAGGIAIMAQTSGKSVDDITKSVVATTSAFNGANRSAVSQGQVLRDVANTADSIKLSLGNNDVAITKAASAARRLGMDLARVDQIAESLMNFEDSIGKELEAELLTGKQLNLEKARELALNNDLKGLSEELFKNSSDIAEFGKMNRIQQESYAAALGMSRDELAKMAYNKAIEAGMTEEQAAAAAKVNAEDMKRVAIQENFAKALEKIAGAVAPILDLVGNLLSIPLAPYILLGVAAMSKLGGSVTGVARGFGGMFKAGKEALTGMLGLLKKGGLSSAIGKLKGAFGEGAGDMVRSKSGKLFSKDSPQGKMITNLSGKAGGAGAASTAATGGKAGGGLMESFSKINTASLLKAAAAMAIASIGIFIFAKAIQELEKVKDWVNVAIGLGAFAGAMGIIGLVGELAAAGLTALAAGLEALGAAMLTGVGALGLAALIAGAIGLGFALNLAAPAIEAYGKVFTAVFAGLTTLVSAVAEGFAKILGAVTLDNIGPMLLLGPALIGVGIGLMTLGVAGIAAFPGILLASLAMSAMVIPLSLLTAVASAGVLPVLITSLMTLGAAAPGLLGVGAGLLSIAAGLAAISIAGPMAIPSLLAVTGLAAVIGGVATIFGGGDKSIGESKSKAEEGSLAAVEAKLTELIAVVKTGGNVYLDSNKVGRAQLMAASSNA
jgi:hypothetical protein